MDTDCKGPDQIIGFSRRTGLLLLLCLLLASGIRAQRTITWDELAEVQFTSRYDPELTLDILTARFSPDLQSLDGQEVRISGYLIPLNAMGTSYVLSRYPNANCFFCGGAGPETVVELRLRPQHI